VATHGADAIIFHELVGFRVEDAEPVVSAAWQRTSGQRTPGVVFSVVAHAPYSVSPALFRAIAHQRREAPLSVHLGESPEEIEFLQTGGGPFRQLLGDLGAWNSTWTPPRCGPVEYLRRVGYLQPGLLAVHAGHLTDDELTTLASAGAVVVACPRSNVWVGAGAPDASRFYRAGVPVALGTDSLASVDTLNLFDELVALRRAAPGIAPARLIESATLVGARALGRARDFGSIAPGKRASLVAVNVPADARDVEEYLVSGVPADRVHRLEIA
jgi:cytosine/adenosine deaminase-related metal-dependent hydrolase